MNSFKKSAVWAITGLLVISNVSASKAIKQPTVPKNYKELPFIEKVAPPTLTAAEQQRGYMLFKRPIMEPVYPNTHPLAYERFSELTAFATPGEFEPLTFSIYPTRALKNFKVTVSELKSANGTIKRSAIDTRLAVYWNIAYPRYTSNSTYRRLPELLEPITAYSSPALECQRWWLTVQVPKNAAPGIYTGKITLRDDSSKAVVIPVKFRVLDFKLLADPNKHYSVYYYMKNRVQYGGKSDKEARKMLDNEYQAMRDMGLNMIPTMRLDWDAKNKKISLRHADEMERMMKLGLKGPIPVTSSGVIHHFYLKTTPGGKVSSHWKLNKLPPPECYVQIKQAFKQFIKASKAKNWPEFYCCPIDEVTASSKEFGAQVYQAVSEAGMKTYITKNPVAGDAAVYKDFIDAWCSQPYSVPYKNIVKQSQYEYWSYPNHNAGEIKNRLTMSKGGRMTYGYGFWRSGFTTLIPWHWSWVMKPSQFDYLRSRRSGCGQRIAANGEVIPSTYWACFREGIDDNRYIYTLQQAIWARQNSDNPQCRKLVVQAQAVLQKLWDDINVQEKYLRAGMWASAEFNARRWQLAQCISALLKYPTTRQGQAPSVIVNTRPAKIAGKQSIMAREIARGNIEVRDLADSFSQWKNQTPEGKITLTKAAGLDGKTGLLWTVNVDHHAGSKGYPIGWPRMRCYYKPALDFTQYDYLKYMIKLDSNRNEVDDDVTKLGFTVKSNKFFEVTKDMGGRQRVWLPVIFNIHEMIDATAQGKEPWREINLLQLFIAEKYYKDKTKISFAVGTIQLLRFKTPVIAKMTSPEIVLLPAKELLVQFELMGNLGTGKAYKVIAELQNKSGKPVYSVTGKINAARTILLNIEKLTPGKYQLVLKLSGKGKTCSQFSKTMNFLPGPFFKAQ